MTAGRRKSLCEPVEAIWRHLAGAGSDEPFPWDEDQVMLTYRRALRDEWGAEDAPGIGEGA
jgi:hypothetical protein